MSYFIPISNYPTNEASGIARNVSIWIQFNKTLDTSTVDYTTVSVTDDSFIALEGTIECKASSEGPVPDSIIKFTPEVGFDAYKRYGFFIQGGSHGIRSYTGDTLKENIAYYFTTAGHTVSNTDIAASGVPLPSAYIPTEELQIVSTYPVNYDTNIQTNLGYIRIQFNDAIPSGINLYDKIKFSTKKVLRN